MNVNELNCRANQKVIESLDQRVAVLEEGGGGAEYTAGDGIKIENDTISLKEWRVLTSLSKSDILSSSNVLLKDILLEVLNYETNYPVKIRMYKGDTANATVSNDNVNVDTSTASIIDTDYRFETTGETVRVRRIRNILTFSVDSTTQNVTGNIYNFNTLLYYGTTVGNESFRIWIRD